MQLVKHGPGALLDPLMDRHVIEAFGKRNARVGQVQDLDGFQLTKRPGNLRYRDTWKQPAHICWLKRIGLVMVRLAGFGLTAPVFDLVRREIHLEG